MTIVATAKELNDAAFEIADLAVTEWRDAAPPKLQAIYNREFEGSSLERYETARKVGRSFECKMADFQRRPAVDWPEKQVMSAVRHLCGRDEDGAVLLNDAGWSATDSKFGHAALALYNDGKRDKALMLARRLVGKYQRQLKAAGII